MVHLDLAKCEGGDGQEEKCLNEMIIGRQHKDRYVEDEPAQRHWLTISFGGFQVGKGGEMFKTSSNGASGRWGAVLYLQTL